MSTRCPELASIRQVVDLYFASLGDLANVVERAKQFSVVPKERYNE